MTRVLLQRAGTAEAWISDGFVEEEEELKADQLRTRTLPQSISNENVEQHRELERDEDCIRR